MYYTYYIASESSVICVIVYDMRSIDLGIGITDKFVFRFSLMDIPDFIIVTLGYERSEGGKLLWKVVYNIFKNFWWKKLVCIIHVSQIPSTHDSRYTIRDIVVFHDDYSNQFETALSHI